ncbi:MAG: hypothetical protein Q9183_002730, partial [Haloplaca sp. 2 TL-2023]
DFPCILAFHLELHWYPSPRSDSSEYFMFQSVGRLKKMKRSWKSRQTVASGDADAELHVRRARNDQKLKSIFESIFEKYSKDFSDVADEIDMNTGKVVRENGHILNMMHEKDLGVDEETTPSESNDQSAQDCLEQDPSSRTVQDSQDYESSDDDPLGSVEDAIQVAASRLKQSSFKTLSRLPTSVERTDYRPPTDDIWWAPELPQDTVLEMGLPSPDTSDVEGSDATRSPSPPGTSLWALPWQRAPRSKLGGLSKYNSNESDVLSTPSTAWTTEEDDLLRFMKSTTTLKYDEFLDRFPGRTVISLRSRWGLLNNGALSEPFLPRENAWAAEEDRLLRHLRSSTNKRWVEIQHELPGRSVNALRTRWHLLRLKAAQSSLRDKSPSSDSFDLPSLEEMIQSNVTSQKWPPKKSIQPELLTHTVESSRIDTADNENVDDSAHLARITHDELESPAENGMRRRFPTGTIIPDSQSGTGSQVQSSGPGLDPHPLSESHVNRVHSQNPGLAEDSVDMETSHKPYTLRTKPSDSSLQETHKEASPTGTELTFHPGPTDMGEQLPVPVPNSGPEIGIAAPPTFPKPHSNGTLSTDGTATGLTSGLECRTESTAADMPDIIEISSSSEPPKSSASPERASNGSNRASPSLVCSLQPESLAANATFDTLGQGTYRSEKCDLARESTGSGTEFPAHPATTSLVFKHVRISMPSLAIMGDPRPGSPMTIGTPVGQKTGLAETPSKPSPTPERRNRWIEPFTLTLPSTEATADEVLEQRHKYFTNKAYLVQKESPAPLHEAGSRQIQNQADIPPSVPDMLDQIETHDLGELQSMENLRSLEAFGTVPMEGNDFERSSPMSGQKRKRGMSPMRNAGDDEDDLQFSLAPAMVPPIWNSRRKPGFTSVHRLPFRPRVETPDISDDELSTPAKSIRQQVEMTPVRSLTTEKRRQTSMF